jgi:hypothetical protein
MSSTLRNLAYAGAIAGLIGCAGIQKKVETGDHSNKMTGVEETCRKKRMPLQACIVDTIIGGCRTENKDEEPYLRCAQAKLAISQERTRRTFSIEATAGSEVFSIRYMKDNLIDIASVRVITVKDLSVELGITIDRIDLAKPNEKKQVVKGSIIVDDDGELQGDTELFGQLEVSGLGFSRKGDGKALIRFATEEPGIIALSEPEKPEKEGDAGEKPDPPNPAEWELPDEQ